MTQEQINYKVEKQEKKTRKMLDKLIPMLFKNNFVKSEWKPILCNIDYQFTALTSSYDIEVKEFNHTLADMYSIGGCGLKERKYELMQQYHNSWDGNEKLIYMVLLNDAIVVYDFAKVDKSKFKHFIWRQKKTQYNDDSEIIEVPAFNIPLDQAIIIKIDKQQYADN